MTLATLDDPQPAAGQVVIDIASAGVNRADLLQRAGHYPPPPGAPSGLGLEVSGTISAVGPTGPAAAGPTAAGPTSAGPGAGAPAWAVGDPVVALVDGGGYAERVAVGAGQVLPAPHGIDLADAAGLPEAACTVWSNLVDVAHLSAGQRVLIHGGSGGVGTLAIQFAHALGADVATTAGGPDRVERCRTLGADLAIDYRTEDFTDVVRDRWGGVDVILDVIGAAYLERNLRALAMDGTLVIIGLQKGARAEIDLGRLLSTRATVVGTTLRARSAADKARIIRGVRRDIWPLVEAGRIRPVTHTRFPLSDAAAAHHLLDSGTVFGKVLLHP